MSTATSARSWPLAFGASRSTGGLIRGSSGPSLAMRGGSLRLSGLPAGTGIVELFLHAARSSRPSALVKRGRPVRLTTTVLGASSKRLAFKLAGRRQRGPRVR